MVDRGSPGSAWGSLKIHFILAFWEDIPKHLTSTRTYQSEPDSVVGWWVQNFYPTWCLFVGPQVQNDTGVHSTENSEGQPHLYSEVKGQATYDTTDFKVGSN